MLGYVTIEKSELKIREYDMYQGYYCGICKSIGKRYGQIPRMALSYDAVFLALLLSSLDREEDNLTLEHCIIHYIEKKPVVYGNKAIDYAADVMVILAYHKFLDDWKDDHSKIGFAGKTALGRCYGKLAKIHPDICRNVETSLENLSQLEKGKSGNLDQVSNGFADIMETLFTGYNSEEKHRRLFGELGRSLGKWIYVIDAFDDVEKDIQDGAYNPLIYRKAGLEGVDNLMYNCLAEVSGAYDLLPIEKNKGILDNIIFIGLRRRTDVITQKGNKVNE